MKRYAPLITLLAVAVLGGALFLLNAANDPANRPAATAAPASATPAAAPTATTTVDVADLGRPAPTTINLADLAPPATPPPAIAEKAYTGRSSGNEVTVAIAVKDGRAVAYVCDGKKIEAWLEGTLSGSDVSLASADGATTITGTLDDARSLGTVTVGQKSWPYAAKAVVAPAGLYEGRANIDGVANRIGWIVLDDGGQTGANRVGGEVQPAPALDPANLDGVTINGVKVDVTGIGGDDAVIQR